MTKATFSEAIAKAKAAGITSFTMRCEGGNRLCYHNEVNGRIIMLDDKVISVELSRNYAKEGTRFVVAVMEYEDIDSIFVQDSTFTETIEMLKQYGVYDADTEKFFQGVPARMDLHPGTAGMAVVKDKDGNTTIGTGRSGYVTT